MNCIPYVLWVAMQLGTVTPTVTPTSTPLPICEFTQTPAPGDMWDDDFLIPIYFETPQPSITPTINLTQTTATPIPPTSTPNYPTTTTTPTGTWYGWMNNLTGIRFTDYYDGAVRTTNRVTSMELCGADNAIQALVVDVYASDSISNGCTFGYASNLVTRNYWRCDRYFPQKKMGSVEGGVVPTSTTYNTMFASFQFSVTGAISLDHAGASYVDLDLEKYQGTGSRAWAQNYRGICRNSQWEPTQSVPTTIPTGTTTPTATSTPCRNINPLDIEDPVGEYDNNFQGQSCYAILPHFEFSVESLLDSLPDWMDLLLTNVIDAVLNTVGIEALPEIHVEGVTLCLDRYLPTITLLGINLIPYITALISLISIGLVISEFRS